MTARTFLELLFISLLSTGLLCYAASDLSVTTIQGATPDEVKINLVEDEVILPPYLQSFSGGSHLNVTPATKPQRSANPKELLDYGDSFRLIAPYSLQVIGREHFQWVGGGVFQGRFFGPSIKKSEIPYGLRFDRGWLRVWVDEPEPGVRIETPNGTFTALKAQLWMHVENGNTEVYLLSGGIKSPDGTVIQGVISKYLKWKPGAKAPSEGYQWSQEQLETNLHGVYGGMVELAKKADKEWEDGEPEKTYADLRQKGWRKSTRFVPAPK
ncbi:MAG: hypothetical protein JST80_03605 [Bdellovibrionales bacterium]|nr:hypothetical protein [Bdellovibrionales bacterium]